MNSELINKFSDIWSNIFNKNKSVFVESGTKAITHALRILKSKVVVIPTYTCDRILKAALDADCNPIIVDCEKDLQIDISELSKYEYIDTVIVPHMFGIKADVKLIKSMGYNVIEDCSQAMGFDDIGKYSDVVIKEKEKYNKEFEKEIKTDAVIMRNFGTTDDAGRSNTTAVQNAFKSLFKDGIPTGFKIRTMDGKYEGDWGMDICFVERLFEVSVY